MRLTQGEAKYGHHIYVPLGQLEYHVRQNLTMRDKFQAIKSVDISCCGN